jgi:hypothetical protein
MEIDHSKFRVSPRERTPARSLMAGVILFVFTGGVFYLCPANQMTDSMYSMLLSETMLHRHGVDLNYAHLKSASPESSRNGEPYQTILVKGRLLYYLGWGSSILALPAVAVFNAAGISTLDSGGTYDWKSELRIQRPLAAAVASAAVCAIFAIGTSAELPLSWAVAIALGTAFGTQVWSGASRGLWSQTWFLFFMSVSIWLLLRWDRGRGVFRPVFMATLLSLIYFVRPASASTILIISIYVFLTYPKGRLAYFAAGLVWLGVFVVFSFHFFRAPLPPYYHEFGWLTLDDIQGHVAGVLLSPSRGLLIYCPVVLFSLYVTIAYWRRLEHRGLALVACAAIVANLAIVSSIKLWWGGWSYGPRELTDSIPFFALLTILGCKGLLWDNSISAGRRRGLIAAGVVLVAFSIALNAPGALSEQAFAWNAWADVDHHPERLWDWRHAQFLAPFFTSPPRQWVTG